MAKRKTSKRRNEYGLHARTFPVSVRAYVDQDYLDKLSEEDKQWLSDFNDRFYGADFRDNPEDWSVAERRTRYSAKNCANGDIFSAARHFGLVEDATEREDLREELGDKDLSSTPSYLNSPEYKAARDAFREQLTQGRRAVNPKPSAALNETRRTLEEITNGQAEEE